MNITKIIVEGSNDKFISISEDHWFTDNTNIYPVSKIECGTEVLLDKSALKKMLESVEIFDDFVVTIKKVDKQYSVYFSKTNVENEEDYNEIFRMDNNK